MFARAQEAESWQATIREGFAKVIDVHPDEPFEQTWQHQGVHRSPSQTLLLWSLANFQPLGPGGGVRLFQHQLTEELAAMKENLAMLKSRSSALEKVGEEADAEIISLYFSISFLPHLLQSR
jgi:hypothetical protein